jgi:hypothetical protein
MSSDDALFSWITDSERISRVHENYTKSHQEMITVHFIYINIDSYISDVSTETHILAISENGESCIADDDLLRLIQSKKSPLHTNLKYRLSDIFLYNVIIEPENIQSYINSEDASTSFMNSIPLTSSEIIVLPSIPAFHDTNRIYFIYNEVVPHLNGASPMSVLVDGTLVPAHRKTKRVKFAVTRKSRNTRRA